jgi:ankyrin repeat protein
MLASYGGHLEVVRWLLEEGAVANHQDGDGYTALHLACSKGHTPVVR